MKHPDRPFLVAITGGIASGKSVVSKWFEEQKFLVFYTDRIGHDLFNDQYFKNKIEDIFGKEITIDGSIDRAKLGEIIFNSADKRKQLNELLHPEIRKRIQQIIETSSNKIIIFEIPLLFENGLQNAFDLTINISARNEIRIKRIMERNKISKETAQKRIDSQMSEPDKQKLVDVNISNEKNIEELHLHLYKFLPLIKKLKKKNVKKITEI